MALHEPQDAAPPREVQEDHRVGSREAEILVGSTAVDDPPVTSDDLLFEPTELGGIDGVGGDGLWPDHPISTWPPPVAVQVEHLNAERAPDGSSHGGLSGPDAAHDGDPLHRRIMA